MRRELIWGIALTAVGLIGLAVVWAFMPGPGPGGPAGWRAVPCPMCPGRIGGGAPFVRPSRFESNGEMIYYTATSDRGTNITASLGPPWFQMHGGSCIDCHAEDGRGGAPVMMGRAIPGDIRYTALTHPHRGHTYTDALIKRAITDGLAPDGKPLDPTMPRWRMSDQDLNDLIAYLKTLDSSARR